ncbi:DUF2505 family protein [Corynebacterium auriscanis]|uniref:DUF2505 family protein n=1 Tax=Corynebacterium auriscanis TaxID=99807 RepID=UPI003CEDBCDD
MAQTKRVSRTLNLSIDQVREIVTSEAFLLTKENMVEAGDSWLDEGVREVEADGTVRAGVDLVRPAQEEAGVPEMRTHQDTKISPLVAEGVGRAFALESALPLPGNIGEVTTRYRFAGGGSGPGRPAAATEVEAVVTVNCKMPFVGKKIENSIMENTEKTVDSSLERIRRFS